MHKSIKAPYKGTGEGKIRRKRNQTPSMIKQQRIKIVSRQLYSAETCTDKKENKIYLAYNEMKMGSGANSYMRKGFLICEEMSKYLTIYEEAFSHM